MNHLNRFTQFGHQLQLKLTWAILVTLILSALLMAPTVTSKQGNIPLPKPAEQGNLWAVHLYAIPGSDATSLYTAVENVGNSCQEGNIEFRAKYGGSSTPVLGLKDGGEDRYVAVIPDFFPGCSPLPCTAIEYGTLEVVCKQPQLASRTLNFRRYYAPDDAETNIYSDDGSAILRIFPSSLDGGRYVIVMATNIWPGGSPPGVQFVGEPYSFRASGLIPQSDENMSLTLNYSNELIGETDSLTARLFEWDTVQKVWLNTGDQTNSNSGGDHVNKATKRFSTSILGTTPLWCDGFSDNRGLEISSVTNINRLLADGGKLKLDITSLPGTAMSKPYTPTMALEAWGTVSYTTIIPLGANITVSVLSLTGTTVISNVSPGDSLANIDPDLHPSLRLGVEMSTTSGESPELFDWCLEAQPDFINVYLPLILK